MSDNLINKGLKLDFEQRARAVALEDSVTDDEYQTAAEIIFLRDANTALLTAVRLLANGFKYPAEVCQIARAAVAKATGEA